MGSVSYVARPRAIKFIGDSHAARYDGLVFADRGEPAGYVITQAHNHYGFRCTELSDEHGTLNDRLVRSLLTLNFVRGAHVNALPELGRFHTGPGPTGWDFGVRLRARFQNEALVISCGEIDARDVIRRLPLDARIALPVPLPDVPPHRPAGEAIAFEALAADIEADYLAPFYRGMRIVRDIGLKSIFLLAIPPPGVDDAAFEAHTGFASHAHVRYAVHRTINLLFERFCAAEQIAFVDTWALVTDANGIIEPRFVADGIHLNRDAAVEIVAAIAERLDLPPADPLDPLL